MTRKTILKDYFKAVTDVAIQGDAREESFYSCLETLLQQFAASSGRSQVHVTTLPKKTEAGNPEFGAARDILNGLLPGTRPRPFSAMEA